MNSKQLIFFLVYIFLYLIYYLFCHFQDRKKERIKKSLSIPLKVVNLGLSRTGTSSFNKAMSMLGFQSWHFSKQRPEYLFNKGYNCVSDLPYYRTNFSESDICANTIYFLTIRKPICWLKSLKKFLKHVWNFDLNNPYQLKLIKNFKLNFSLEASPFPFTCIDYFIHNIRNEYLDMIIDNHPQYFILLHLERLLKIFKKKKIPLFIVALTSGSHQNKWQQLYKPLESFGIQDKLNNYALQEPFPQISHGKIYRQQLRNML